MSVAATGFDIGRPDLQVAPFKHILVDRCLDPHAETALLDWFERDAPWRLVETDFYEQYEFSLFHETLPPAVARLFDECAMAALRRQLSETFGVSFTPRLNAIAHKLTPGQRIAIHNDYLVGEETHRLTVQLNRGLDVEAGGLFMLFNSFDPTDIHSIHRPLSRSGIGFAIGPDSHHAVSRMHAGERFTIVFSFYAEPVDF
ncbi:MAG: cyclophane-containing peptide 2OG-Fe(II) oxygenase YhhC [Brevundimonas sp.]|jgi:hypothetical protein|uniref:cyclophane-containing peptide 2OG-Fe(II) oxygenase YhhC n=1 Tax=Brevundimonas TaxID=41275 RepID=UPI0022AC0350|nr:MULTISPECIES: cyclophane-containing peptide 2OG-Fe(II) oxygenase YhhC [Brevundimonas]